MRGKRTARLFAWLMIGGLVICIGASAAFIGCQLRQEQLDGALVRAVRSVDAAAVTRLLRDGANPNSRSSADSAPRTLLQLLRELLARWLHKRPVAVGTPVLHMLLEDDRLYYGKEDAAAVDTIAAALVDHGASIRELGYRQELPLDEAAMYHLHRTLQRMLSKGTDVNHHDDFGLTALMSTDVYGAVLLIEHGADVNARDLRGYTVLSYANSLQTADLLIRHGAKVNVADDEGYSILYHTLVNFAGNRDQAATARLLKQHGARLNARDRDALRHGRTTNP